MEVKDLMIGDWVEVDGEYTDVTSISRTEISTGCMKEVDIRDVKPIPITAQCLDDSGFHTNQFLSILRVDHNHYLEVDSDEGVILWEEKSVIRTVKFMAKVKYVHELQHALRLCNINKGIEL